MDRFIALFYALDHHGTVAYTEAKTSSISPIEDPTDFSEWLVGQFASLSDTHSNMGFAGVYPETDGQVLDVAGIMGRVVTFEEGADSSFFQRHDHNADFLAGLSQRRSLEMIVETAAEEGLDLWYESEAEIPDNARDFFAAYTLVYVDYDDESVIAAPVYLYEDFDASLTKFLVDEIFGVIGPVALFEGLVDPIVTGDVFERSEAFKVLNMARKQDDQDTVALVNTTRGGSLVSATQGRTVPEILAEFLTRKAVVDFSENDTGDLARRIKDSAEEPYEAFLDILHEKRPLVLFETQYWEIAEHVARFVANSLNLDFISANSYYEPYETKRFNSTDRVIFYDDQLFAGDYELDRSSVRAMIKDLVTSRDVGIVVVSNPRAVPLTFQNYMDMEMILPAMVGPVRDQVFQAILGESALKTPELDSWTRYLLPYDFDKVLAAGFTGARAVSELRERVERRLSRRAANNAPSLSEIHGLGEAKEVADQLVSDIRLAVAGEIDWTEVDRGMLLVGPPGTGKTMLAKAISKESGIRFIAGSALEWQASGALDSHLAAIREFFAEARRYAPTIVFIDEFDSIGNRQHHQGRNDYYTTAVVNCVLEELQGFHDRDGVIVIAATNESAKIDPALKRAGRLDQTVTVRRPNVPSLAKIYDYHIGKLRRKDQVEDPIDTEELAKLTFGQTGADVEFYVRGGRRRARKERRPATQGDFIAEIMRRPLGATGLPRMTADEIRRTAVHEAGHAMVQLLGETRGSDISFVSIIPRPDGTLGFVASYSERVDVKKADVLDQVRIFLGGRAAEEVVYGKDNVGAGAGGSGSSDLAQATRLLIRMFMQHGYSERGGLVWFDIDQRENMDLPAEVRDEVRQTLDRQYRETVRMLRENRAALDRIVKVLLEKQEITGGELRDMFSRRGGLFGWLGGKGRENGDSDPAADDPASG
ncbi:MAG: AAA family ATPase [Alphaproteobacteria bacterium]